MGLYRIGFLGLYRIWLRKDFSLSDGYGYYVQIHTPNHRVGHGFHKSNKFTAVKQALKDLGYMHRFEIRDRAVRDIRLAIGQLNALGIECSFDGKILITR